MDVFSARDLRLHSGALLRDTENGQISLITKHGKPTILAIPFDKQLLQMGINQDLAIHLFEKRLISLSKAAKIASLSIEEFMEILSEIGIECVDYPPDELDKEMKVEI